MQEDGITFSQAVNIVLGSANLGYWLDKNNKVEFKEKTFNLFGLIKETRKEQEMRLQNGSN